ncbi:hypothetical protein SteCoe_27354 [Stentor coeruleus]|uniref:Uncharacterized protein n=1 Tax=Stentor coeruleus TaxID=5963 RepID=A0A1R2BAS7_9CILI|nr:hypothetical protein SteCoe_27354 [Stentor coeruleus]
MILPPIKIIQKRKDYIQQAHDPKNYFSTPLRKFDSTLVRKLVLQPYPEKSTSRIGETLIQTNTTHGYKGYSKAKNILPNKKIANYLEINHNTISVPEYSITPEYLNTIKLLSNEVLDNFSPNRKNMIRKTFQDQRGYLESQNLPNSLYKSPKLPSSRIVVLSKTPDPWSKHIHKPQIKSPNLSSSSSSSSLLFIENHY